MESIRIFLLKGKENMIDHVKSIQTLGCAYWKKLVTKFENWRYMLPLSKR